MFTGPSAPETKALLTGPKADVHFRERAVERFTGIIRAVGELARAL